MSDFCHLDQPEMVALQSLCTFKHHVEEVFSYLQHLFEYIGTQFPPPSSLLYGKMGSITLFFSNGNIKYDTTFYA